MSKFSQGKVKKNYKQIWDRNVILIHGTSVLKLFCKALIFFCMRPFEVARKELKFFIKTKKWCSWTRSSELNKIQKLQHLLPRQHTKSNKNRVTYKNSTSSSLSNPSLVMNGGWTCILRWKRRVIEDCKWKELKPKGLGQNL